MEILIEKSEYGFRTFHVGANGAYDVIYTYFANPEALLSQLVAAEEVFVPAPNFWGDAFREEFITTARNFPEAAELVLYHRVVDDDEILEAAAWGILRARAEDRKEFFEVYLHGCGAENIYEFVSKAPVKLIQILANIVKKL